MSKNYATTVKSLGIWIPEVLITLEELNWHEKIILLRIFYLSKTDSGCFASNKHLGELTGLSEKTVQNNISILRKKGFIIDVRRKPPFMRWIKVSPTIEKLLNPPYIPDPKDMK